MARNRFKVVELSATRLHVGVITVGDLRKRFQIPDEAEVTIHVPGDVASNTDLSIEDAPIQVRWEEVK